MLDRMREAGTIARADLELLLVTDDVAQAMAHIETHAVQTFGLKRRAVRPSPMLGEPPPLATRTAR